MSDIEMTHKETFYGMSNGEFDGRDKVACWPVTSNLVHPLITCVRFESVSNKLNLCSWQWFLVLILFCCSVCPSTSATQNTNTSNETKLISTFDIYRTSSQNQVPLKPLNISTTYSPSSHSLPSVSIELTTPRSNPSSTEYTADLNNPYSNRISSLVHSDKNVALESGHGNHEPRKTVFPKEELTLNNEDPGFYRSILPEPYVKILEPDDNYERHANTNKKRPDVSVTIYHHQAVHDPMKNYGNGKPWNFYGNGYGLHYGYDLDGNYSRQKGYQFEKAHGRDFCKEENCRKEKSQNEPMEKSENSLQNHIFNVMKSENVDIGNWLNTDDKNKQKSEKHSDQIIPNPLMIDSVPKMSSNDDSFRKPIAVRERYNVDTLPNTYNAPQGLNSGKENFLPPIFSSSISSPQTNLFISNYSKNINTKWPIRPKLSQSRKVDFDDNKTDFETFLTNTPNVNMYGNNPSQRILKSPKPKLIPILYSSNVDSISENDIADWHNAKIGAQIPKTNYASNQSPNWRPMLPLSANVFQAYRSNSKKPVNRYLPIMQSNKNMVKIDRDNRALTMQSKPIQTNNYNSVVIPKQKMAKNYNSLKWLPQSEPFDTYDDWYNIEEPFESKRTRKPSQILDGPTSNLNSNAKSQNNQVSWIKKNFPRAETSNPYSNE